MVPGARGNTINRLKVCEKQRQKMCQIERMMPDKMSEYMLGRADRMPEKVPTKMSWWGSLEGTVRGPRQHAPSLQADGGQ